MKLTESNALARVAAYCSKAERCEYDVRKKLLGWELTEEEQQRIIERLRKEKFLDERRFVQSFVKDKIRFNKWGKAKISFELRKKKIPADIINECLGELDESELDESLRKILETKNKSIKAQNDYERKTKLIRFALSRGFSMDQVLKTLTGIIGNTDEEYF
ncbi:regulatory protein RecX [Dysgonomonas sp. 520]|uniref:regulatory protein RecX n=1 Tax=Dysgonomonas sp. 520 TaxID=2302931 RepID=UPI0013D84A00|nr:regulatory protein RecX [Dysgonomonas sp. 520]NDW08786.1 RecX family transcriptional regulator [Dysgonomonas sp. 520]